MKNNKSEFKELPEDVKFATHDSNNIDFILLEYYVAILIYNGYSFSQLLEPADDIEDKNDKEQMITETTIIVLDFINLNPEFAEILHQNNKLMIFNLSRVKVLNCFIKMTRNFTNFINRTKRIN